MEPDRRNRRPRRLLLAAAAVLLCLNSPVYVRAADLAGLIEEETDLEYIADETFPEDGLTGENGPLKETEPDRESETEISPGRIIRRIREYCTGLDGRWENQEDTTWSIQVNLTTNTVTVFRGKVAVKAFACAAGLREGSTPVGNFQLKDKLRWHELVGPSWGQWCSHITGDILFHTLPYYSNSDNYTMLPEEYNQIGESSSHGCIRLAATDAKYLYDNCPVGTAVTIFNGTAEDDPLGKPMPLFAGKWTGVYDPTDITIAQEGRTSDWMWETWSKPMKEFFKLR